MEIPAELTTVFRGIPRGNSWMSAIKSIRQVAFPLLGLLLSFSAPVLGQNLRHPREAAAPDPVKIAPTLLDLVGMPGASRQALARQRRMSLANGLVEVEIDLLPDTVWDATAYRALYGVETVYVGFNDSRSIPYVWAKLPPENLARLVEERTEITFVRPPATAVAEQTTQGAELTGATLNQHSAGFKGKDVKVAVIDLGFDRWKDAQSAGELPGYLATNCDSPVRGCLKGFTDGELEFQGSRRQNHGTVVAEIVRDMAPEADLYLLHINTSLQLRQAVDFCINNGIKIINHSVAWFNESLYDGRGPISEIAAYARDNGILWINSAGNHARQHYQGQFNDPDRDGWHNFLADDETITMRLVRDQEVNAELVWSSAATASDGDYDLYLLDEKLDADAPVAKSTRAGTKPARSLSTTIQRDGVYHLAIRRTSGTRNHVLALFVTSPAELPEHRTLSRSLPDPAVSERVLAVGAISYTDWKSADTLEPFSSLGPTNGGLMKPDICAPDRVDTYIHPGKESRLFGFLLSATGGFSGTSASAPHVAGAAALLWNRFPDATAADIRAMLEGNATTFDGELRNNRCGAGLLNLPATVARPSIRLVSAVRIIEPGPYYAGQAVTAQFTIQNVGSGCMFLGAVTLGGRAQNNSVLDFPWNRDIVLCEGDQYTYSELMKLPSSGNYHFFATYKTVDGAWNTSLPGAGPANTLDISTSVAPMAVMGIDGGLGGNPARLLRIDRRTGAATVVGPTRISGINDIAFTPDGALFGVTEDEFLRLNPLTGAAVVIGSLGFSSVTGLASDSSGRLYAGTFNAELLSVDPGSGKASLIGRMGSGMSVSGDLAFAPNGTLYATIRGSAGDQLARVDVNTGRATIIGAVGFPYVFSLTFDQDGALLAGANGDTRTPRLIRINTATGVGTVIGTITNANGLNGLALGRDAQTWTLFKDDLEVNTSAWFAESPWSVTAEQAHTLTHSWSDSPTGNYRNDINRSIIMPTVSLASLNGATLRFWHRFDVEDGYDYCRVWISSDSGKTYQRLAFFTGRSSGWVQSVIDLTRYVGAREVWLAFQIESDWNTTADGWYIDDIDVIGAR